MMKNLKSGVLVALLSLLSLQFSAIASECQSDDLTSPDKKALVDFYMAYFGRPPDLYGLEFWLNELRNGRVELPVDDRIIDGARGSRDEEFIEDRREIASYFLGCLYQDVFYFENQLDDWDDDGLDADISSLLDEGKVRQLISALDTGLVTVQDAKVLIDEERLISDGPPLFPDSDGDGVIDSLDQCPGEDDRIDEDADDTPDCIDQCPGEDDRIDFDEDGTPDCIDDLIDSDGDGVADDDDRCPGADDRIDDDENGEPDCLDPMADSDGDGVANGDDQCPGENDGIDVDQDGIPDCIDGLIDSDGDGVADDDDQCPEEDDSIDEDANGVPDCIDSGGNTNCDRQTGGPGCFGQTWDGKWYTLDEEIKGNVSAGLFVPSRDNYDIAIFSPVGGDRETHWGCGPEQQPLVDTRGDCDFSASLKGDVTYMMRLRLVNGRPVSNSLVVSTRETLDKLASYQFGLSELPSDIGTENDANCVVTTPASEWRAFGPIDYGSVRIEGCGLLDASGDLGQPHIYLKFKAVGPREITATNFRTGDSCAITIMGEDCGNAVSCKDEEGQRISETIGVDCRMYIEAW